MNLNSKKLFAAIYNKYFKAIINHEKERYTFTGGRASCKSSFISICIVVLIVMFPFLNAVIIRRFGKSMRYTVFEQIIWAIDILHLPKSNGKTQGFKIPRSSTAALPIVYVRKNGTEQRILFIGLDDPEKSKSMKISSGYIGILWVEEKTEVDPADLQNIRISALRGGSKYWIFESYNPPSAKRHWCNTEANTYDPNRMVIHTTYLDIPPEWLGEAVLHEIEQTKATNPRAYENIFLGEATGTGLNVFENVELRIITDEEIAAADTTAQGVDWGYYPDPFAYGQIYYNARKHELWVFDELYMLKAGNRETYEATSERMKEHGLDITLDRITADSAEPKSVADWRNWGAATRGAIKGVGSRNAGFKWLQSLSKIIIDPRRTPHAADEFTLYEYEMDHRTGEVLTGYPEGQPDHFLALTRYATEQYWKHAGA